MRALLYTGSVLQWWTKPFVLEDASQRPVKFRDLSQGTGLKYGFDIDYMQLGFSTLRTNADITFGANDVKYDASTD